VLGNIGRYYRPPNLSELFGDRGVVTGNPDLRPEKANNRDIGFRFRRNNLSAIDEIKLEYAYFNNEIEDLILLLPFSLGVFHPLNVDAAHIRGHEVVLSVRAWRHVSITANYTHQDATDQGIEPAFAGKRLPGVAEHEAYVRGQVDGQWGRFFYDVNLLGDNFVDRANLVRIPSRNIHGLGLSVTPPGRGLTVTFEVKNVTDEQTADFAGFPLPGRAFFGTVQYIFQ
jgi:iron complex outermembrane receptor protein